MKKSSKLITFALFTFLIGSVSAFAREMTLEELGNEASKIQKDAGYVYIIGEYAFTSKFRIKTEDIMLASSTIDPENPTDASKMVINQITRIYDDNYVATGWKKGPNALGTKELSSTVNVKYIDYHYIKDNFTVSFNLEGGSFQDGKSSITVVEDDKIDPSSITGENRPTKENYQFKEWVKEDGTPWNFNTDVVTKNITLKATWYDEVNTDTLLENAKNTINTGTKANGYYYDVDFAKETSTLTFEVYDKNKKNSEISSTGLIGDIVSIVKNKNVKSITISSSASQAVTFDEDDVNNGAGPDSNAWSQFAYLLCTLTGKDCSDASKIQESFKTITLGDLLKLGDLTLTITLEEDTARSQNNNVEESYTVKFAYEAKAKVTSSIPEEDVKGLLESYNYTLEDSYSITGENGEYKVSGYVIEQDGVTGFGSSSAKHYFAYTIELEDDVDLTKAVIKLPTKDNPTTDSDYNIIKNLSTKQVTVLMEVEDSETVKYRDVIVEIDGKPTRIRIDFSDLKFKKSSKFTIQSVTKVTEAETKLGTDFGWKKETGFDTTFTIEGSKVKVAGLIPILEEFESGKKPFGDGEDTGYYLPFVIKTEKGGKDTNTGVTVQFIHEGENSKTLTAANFDGNDVIYILRHLDKNATDKTFEIVVDMDGEGENFAPYTLTFDWSELKLQEKTNAPLNLTNISEKDKKQFEGWGYDSSYNSLDFDNEDKPVKKLTGTMKEQVINAEAFGEGKENGYYFDFTFEIPDGIDKSKVTIARLSSSDLASSAKKNFDSSEWTEDGKLSILFRFAEDPKCASSSDNCKLYYKVDFDGDGNEYLPTLYEIDYSDVTFKKSSLVNLDPVTTISGNEWKGFTEGDGYKVEFDKDSSTFKVTGLITIFNDGWTGSENPFGTDAHEHYLAFKLSKAEADGTDSNTVVKFLTDGSGHGDKNTISQSDFGGNKSIYVLKYLDPTTDYENKKFTITIDFDDTNEEYEPYTITIDWSELDFQYKNNIADTILVDASATSSDTNRGYISEENKTEITGWGYSFDNAGNIEIGNDTDGYKLTGTVKEQDVAGAGFKEASGYYVPLKIYGPTIKDAYRDHFLSQADGRKKWTIFLRNEEGTYSEITPSEEDYENGYIVVLFKLDKNGDKKIKYKMDWDGSESNVYLEREITISYEELNYQALNTITYNYKNAEGTDKTESTKVYQNEEATLKDLKNLNTDYRTFDGWYKSDKSKVETDTLTITDDKDETLTAHWTLDADAFIKAVMEDLNKNYGTVDDAEKFKLTMDEATNTITIDVEDSRVLLSEMNDTNIPGAIAYILQKGEITGITLSTGEKKVEFTKDGTNNEIVSKVSLDEDGNALKETIKQGAQALFKDVLSDEEETYTLSKMALNNKDFALEISSNDENVTLLDSANKTYTFKFESESYTVKNESELETALGNEKITHIYLGNDFEITKQHEITRPVVINGGKYHENGNYKISVNESNKAGVDSIFKISSTGVTIDSIELSNTKVAIVVDGVGADLTTTGLKLTSIEKAGINVKNGSLNAKEITFENETHDIPTALVEEGNKKNAKVAIENATKNDPKFVNVTLHRDKKWCKDKGDNYGKDDPTTMESCKTKSWDDEYDYTKDTYYYLKSTNIKNYKVASFMGFQDSMWAYRLYEEGEKIGSFDKFYGQEKITIGNKDYYFVGYGTSRKTTDDIKEGASYSEILKDLENETVGTRDWYHAVFAEKDTEKTVTIEYNSTYNIDAKTFDIYKFKDKASGLTIGELRKIDKSFDEEYKKLEALSDDTKKLQCKKGSSIVPQDVSDETVIDDKLTLVISEVAGVPGA